MPRTEARATEQDHTLARNFLAELEQVIHDTETEAAALQEFADSVKRCADHGDPRQLFSTHFVAKAADHVDDLVNLHKGGTRARHVRYLRERLVQMARRGGELGAE
jgi:ABC-type Na+ transport system ATPase subunit NatA